VELPGPPQSWGWGQTAYVLVGALSHSSRRRGWLAEKTDQPHLIEGLDQVVRRLGGVTARWRFDRMSTVCHPQSGRLQASFGPVAMHYAVGVDLCPPGHGWRKGVVEKAIHTITGRWWRTLADEASLAAAQSAWTGSAAGWTGAPAAGTAPGQRSGAGRRRAAAAAAGGVPGHRGSDPGGPPAGAGRLPRQPVLGAARARRADGGRAAPARRHHPGRGRRRRVLLAHQLRAPDGAGAVVRLDEHVTALQRAVLANFADRGPCRRKDRRPPSAAALAEADRIRRRANVLGGEQVVLDFTAYAAGARPLGHHTGQGRQDGGSRRAHPAPGSVAAAPADSRPRPAPTRTSRCRPPRRRSTSGCVRTWRSYG
jgi:hypothetical protein